MQSTLVDEFKPISADVNEKFERKLWSHVMESFIRTFICTTSD